MFLLRTTAQPESNTPNSHARKPGGPGSKVASSSQVSPGAPSLPGGHSAFLHSRITLILNKTQCILFGLDVYTLPQIHMWNTPLPNVTVL